MTDTNKLSRVDTVADGDLLRLWSQVNGDDRAAAMSVIAAYIQTKITAPDSKITQYASPAASGTTVQVNDSYQSVFLLVTPLAGYAAMTIKMPLLANCIDKQELLVFCSQSVTTLTMDANGATVLGAPSGLAANGFFTLRFDAVNKFWYRTG